MRLVLPFLVRGHRTNAPSLAANADGAEAEDHVAAGSWPAEAHHWTEARKEQHLIELVPQIEALWSGQNLIGDHLAVLVDGDIQKQAVR